MKKMMLVALAALISSNAFALSAKDSWNTILNANVSVSGPQFAGAFGLPNGIFNACVDGNTFKSIAPVKTCTAWKEEKRGHGGEEGEYTEWTCLSYANVDVAISRNAVEQVCVQYDNGEAYTGCVKWESVNVTYPLSYNLAVHNTAGGEDYQAYLFSKDYTIPACGKIAE